MDTDGIYKPERISINKQRTLLWVKVKILHKKVVFKDRKSNYSNKYTQLFLVLIILQILVWNCYWNIRNYKTCFIRIKITTLDSIIRLNQAVSGCLRDLLMIFINFSLEQYILLFITGCIFQSWQLLTLCDSFSGLLRLFKFKLQHTRSLS